MEGILLCRIVVLYCHNSVTGVAALFPPMLSAWHAHKNLHYLYCLYQGDDMMCGGWGWYSVEFTTLLYFGCSSPEE